jgi:methylmalonyl-CoA/ethylmalonyl-CoA epimerase
MSNDIDLPTIKQKGSLPFGTLGALRQVSLVTFDLRKVIDALLTLGIGPWRTFTFDENTVTERTYRGKPGNFAFKNALADMPGLMWEIIQPLSGESIYSDFLKAHGEGGVHHLFFECNDLTWDEKTAALEAAGFPCIQSGKWLGKAHFCYYGTDTDTGLVIEIIRVAPDWKRPEPDEVYGI